MFGLGGNKTPTMASTYGGGGAGTTLLDRFSKNLTETATGFMPGVLHIGSTIGSDVAKAASGNFSNFKSDDLGKQMAKGFWDYSFVPALLTGHPIEAARRASDRPFDALLDLTMAPAAYRGLGRGQQFLGRAIKDQGMVASGSEKLGMRLLSPESGANYRRALDVSDDSFKRGDLSSSVGFADGSVAPTREYLPLTKDDYFLSGDDFWVRHTNRSPILGRLNKNTNPDDVQSYIDNSPFSQNPAGVMGDMFSTLDRDPLFGLSPYRARNESLAKLGDSFQKGLAKLPMTRGMEKIFGVTDATGRGLASSETRDMNFDIDRQLIEVQRAAKQVLDHEAARNPELFKDVDVQQVIEAVTQDAIERSFGFAPKLDEAGGIDPSLADPLATARENLSSEHAARLANEALQKAIEEAKGNAFFAEDAGRFNSFMDMDVHDLLDEHGIQIKARPGLAAYGEKFDPYNQPGMTLRTFLQSQRNSLANPQRKWDIIQLPHRSKGIFSEANAAKEALKGKLSSWLTNSDPQSVAHNLSTKGSVANRHLLDNHHVGLTDEMGDVRLTSDMVDDLFRRDAWDSEILGPIARGEKKLYIKNAKGKTLLEDLYHHGESLDDLESAEQAMITSAADADSAHIDIGRAIREFAEKQYRIKTYDDLIRFELDQRALLGDNPQIMPAAHAEELGVLDRIDELAARPFRGKLDTGSEAYQQFMTLLDDIKTQTGKDYQEALGYLLDNERIIGNRQRTADWAGNFLEANRAMEGGQNDFFPMMRKGRMHEEAEINPGMSYARGQEVIDNRRYLRNPGDPNSLFLTGDFRIDGNVFHDYYRNNRMMLAAERLNKNLQKLTMRVDDVTFNQLKERNLILRGEEVASGTNKQHGGFVEVSRDPYLGNQSVQVRNMLVEMQQISIAKGDSFGANAIGEAIKVVDGITGDGGRGVIGSVRNKLDETGKIDDLANPEAFDDLKRFEAEEGMHYIIPTKIYMGALNEIEMSKRVLGGFLQTFQEGWKYMVLHTRFFQWMRNNIIGAHLMGALFGGAFRYADDFAKLIGRNEDFLELYRMMEADPRLADVIGTGSASLARKQRIIDENPDSMNMAEKGWSKIQDLAEVGSEFNQRFADNPTRIIRTMQLMEDQLQMLEDMTGTKLNLTPQVMDDILNDDVLRAQIARRTKTELVDFSDMTAWERKWLVTIFPFWSWMKGSTKSFLRLWGDKPEAIWGMDKISDAGIDHMEDQHGKWVPEFAQAYYDPGEAGGMVINTGGWNPYMTPFDFGQNMLGVVPDLIPGDTNMGLSYRQYGSDNLISNMNPLIGGAIQSLTGRNTYFGTPIPNKGIGSTMLSAQTTGLPLWRLGDDLLRNETSPTSTREKHRLLTAANYMGFFGLDPRWGNLSQRAVDENTERFKNRYAMEGAG